MTLTPSENRSRAKHIWQSGRFRTVRHRPAALGVELDKWQNKFQLYVSSLLTERPRRHQTTTPLSPTSTSLMTQSSPCGKRPPKSACEQGLCRCRCHIPSHRPRGIIVAAPAHPLHRCQCQTKEVWVNVSLAKLQKFLSVGLSLDWTKGLTVDFSLSYQNTVRCINVARIIIEKCKYRTLGFAEAQEELIRARNAKQLDFADVDTQDEGQLEVSPWNLPQ